MAHPMSSPKDTCQLSLQDILEVSTTIKKPPIEPMSITEQEDTLDNIEIVKRMTQIPTIRMRTTILSVILLSLQTNGGAPIITTGMRPTTLTMSCQSIVQINSMIPLTERLTPLFE